MWNFPARRVITLIFFLGASVFFPIQVAKAQRTIATMDPAAQGFELSFDINTDTTDNIAPNLLFSPDGKKTYVSFTGSGTIICFDPLTGKILSTLKTGGKPSQIFLTPDQTHLLAVNVFTNQIFVVDLSTFTLAATWSYPGVQFGFGNTICFSADGKTGYVTGFRYEPRFLMPDIGDLIRFNVTDGKEAGARLKLQKGPVQMSLSPDKKTLAVVNTVSDTISIVDLPSFTQRAVMTPNTTTDLATDFTFINTVAFSPDSTIGAVCNRRGASSILTSDQAFIFQMSDGTILERLDAGNAPTGTYTTPDGKYFLLLNQFGFKVVDTSTYEIVQDISSPYTEFTGNTNVSFDQNSDLSYLCSPEQDVFMSFRFSTGGMENTLELTPSDDENNKQTMQTAISPDGKITLVLNFKANTIYTIVKTFNTEAPFDANSAIFSGLSLVNTTEAPISFHLELADINSQTFTDVDVNYNLYQDALVPITSSSSKLAQSFKLTTEKENTGLVRLYLKKTGTFTPSAKLTVTIETDSSGTPSGTQVDNALGEVTAESVSTELSYVLFRFTVKAPLVIDTTYWLVLSGTGTYPSEYTAGTRMIEWGVDATDPIYTNGDFAAYTTSWKADSTKDALFKVILSEVSASKELVLQPNQQMSFTQDSFSLDDRDRRGRFKIKAETPGIKGYWVSGRRDLTLLDGSNMIDISQKDLILPEVQQIGDITVGYSKKQDTDIDLLSSGRLAQSFRLDNPATVNRIQVWIRKVGTFSADATIQLSIQTDNSGKPSGTTLTNATAKMNAQDTYTIFAMNEFRFDNEVILEASVNYWLVLEGSGSYSTEYYADARSIFWGVDGDSPEYTAGQFSVYATNWTADSTKDALFKIVIGDQFNLDTLIHLFNPNYNFVGGLVDMIDIDGTSLQTSSASWPGLIRMVGNFETFLSPGISDRTDGYVRMIGQANVAAYEEIGTSQGKAVIDAIPVDEESLKNTKLYFPHFASGDITTQINVINISRETGYINAQDETVTLTNTNKLAQTFQIDQSATINVIRLIMRRTGSFTSSARFKFHLEIDKSGVPSGSALPHSSLEFSVENDLTTVGSRINLRFSEGVDLVAGTTYWLILEPLGSYTSEFSSTKKQLLWGVDATSPTYTKGQFYTYDGTTWTADSTKDAVFQISLAENNEVVISLYSFDGNLVAQTGAVVLASGGQWKLPNLFPELNDYQFRKGWLLVESSKPGIVGSVVFTNKPMDFVTGGLLKKKGIADTLFAQVAHGSGWETGWSLLNPGEITADITLDIYDPQGEIRFSKKIQLNPRNSRAFYFGELFPDAPDILSGYARIRSSQPLVSFSLLTDDNVRFLATIPAQPWQ